MSILKLKYLPVLLLIILLVSSPAHAQLNIDGLLGMDLHAIGSSSRSHANTYSNISSSRLISNHYLSLGKRGFIKNNQFVSYSLYSSFNGYFNTTNSGLMKESFYKSPNLKTFTGNLVLFPSRPYSLQLYYLRLKDVGIIYNKNNRSKTDILTPGLASIQKNRIENEKYGTDFKTVLFKNASFKANYGKSISKDMYDFDFDENRNILITSTALPGDLFNPNVSVSLTNDLIDDTIQVVSGTINVVIPPKFSITIEFTPGFHLIDIIPLHKYKQSSISLNLEQGQFYRIFIETADFPTYSDNYKDEKEGELEFSYTKRNLGIKTAYTYLDRLDKIYDKEEIEKEFKNGINYTYKRKYNLTLLTEKEKRDDSRSGLSKLSDVFRNNTILDYTLLNGFGASITNNYTNSKITNEDGSLDKTVDKVYEARVSKLSEKLKHDVSLKGIYSKQDKAGNVNSIATEKGVDIANKFQFNFKNILFTPSNSIKMISRNRVDSLEKNANDLDVITSLEGLKNNVRYFGDVTSKLKYSYNRKKDDLSSKIDKTYTWDASLIREINDKNKIRISIINEWKTFGGETFETGDSLSQSISSGPKPTEHSSMFGVNYKTLPWEDVEVTSSLNITKSPGSKDIFYGLSVEAYIPWIRVPFTTDIVQQSRNLEGFPNQGLFETETVIAYSLNQMRFEFKHFYTREKLVLDTYTYYEFSFKISRLFKI